MLHFVKATWGDPLLTSEAALLLILSDHCQRPDTFRLRVLVCTCDGIQLDRILDCLRIDPDLSKGT